jgi:uncharacterized repeat protein (TIGR01451 family)
MKSIKYKIGIWLTIIAAFMFVQRGVSQTTATCQLLGTPSSEVSVALPSVNILTGLDFNLAISVPGINCDDYTVKIVTSGNLQLSAASSSYPIVFTATGVNQYENVTVLPSTSGLNFAVPFKFKPGVTCNGETGTFNITINTSCSGEAKECKLNVSIKAIAQNYWEVKKEHIWGNLSGGSVLWKITLYQLPHQLGIGDYNIYSGTLTDVLSSGQIQSVSPGLASGIGTSTAIWNTGTILSTVPYVEYYVYTTSCDSAGTVVENCVKYNFCLAKPKKIDDKVPIDKPDKKAMEELQQKEKKIGPVPVLLCCASIKGEECAQVTLTGIPSANTNFAKYLTYGTNLNYAQGCEGEYLIQISNSGNIPLDNLVLTDQIPPGITVTSVTVYSSGGVNMAYTTTNPTGTGNTLNYQPFTGILINNPDVFTFSTTSGQLLGGTIFIRIRFTINAVAGTPVNNCANLTYDGTYTGWANICNIPIPPVPPSGTIQSCAPFTVEPPKAIPGLKKCITSGIQTYNIGDCIPFRIVVSNHGQSTLNGYTLSDVLSSPQFLEICGPVTYGHGVSAFTPNYTGCIDGNSLSTPMSTIPPGWINPINTNVGSQNPSWNITGMPGECSLDKAYYLVIEVTAKVRPTTWGNYTNTAVLTDGITTLSSAAPYNIVRLGKLDIDKKVNSGPGTSFGTLGYVDPGQPFAFQLIVTNNGSVRLNNIDVTDNLPPCVTFNNASGIVYRNNGTTSAVAVGAPPGLNLTPSVDLEPGEYIVITINVTRNANDNGVECCDPTAFVMGVAADNNMNVYSNSGKACVVRTLCCDMENSEITLTAALIQVFGVQYVNLNLGITAGNLPIQEVSVSLVDYHIAYDNPNCKPADIGMLTGHISSTTSLLAGGLLLATPNTPVNNSLTWQPGTPVDLSGGTTVNIRLWRPWILNIPCCSGTINYCFKVIIKDVDCRVCEKIVCLQSPLPKPPKKIKEDMKEIFEKSTLEQDEK